MNKGEGCRGFVKNSHCRRQDDNTQRNRIFTMQHCSQPKWQSCTVKARCRYDVEARCIRECRSFVSMLGAYDRGMEIIHCSKGLSSHLACRDTGMIRERDECFGVESPRIAIGSESPGATQRHCCRILFETGWLFLKCTIAISA